VSTATLSLLTTPLPVQNAAAPRWDAATARGPRVVNADAIAVHADAETGLTGYVVADGVGDSTEAANAARLAADTAARAAGSVGPVDAIRAAQWALRGASTAGDTVLAVAVPRPDPEHGWCDVAWVGDCRVYHWNGRVLEQVTTDHTVAEHYRSRGLATLPRMEHLVTTSVRTVRPGRTGHCRTGLGRGRLLLCSDGVHKVLSAPRLRAELDSAAPAGEVAARLVAAAHELGGRDNATALVVDPPAGW
jgi:PPM family protein phosphatase